MTLLAPAAWGEIRYVADRKLWHIEAGPVSYVLGVNEKSELQSIYWGKRLWREDDLAPAHSNPEWASFDNSGNTTPQEYPGWGGGRYIEPCLKVTLPDGVRDLVLHYVSHTIDGDKLRIEMKDISYDLGVTLVYRAYPESGIIRKSAIIRNATKGAVTLESAQSGAWNLPRGEGYRLTYLSGRWAGEWQINREPIHPGMKVIESRRGNTGHQANPWFAIDADGRADEETGRVWFGAIGWSGNWRLSIEQTSHQQVRVTGGFNPFDFSYPLAPGQSLETPPFYAGYTEAGFGEASRILHRFERVDIMPGGTSARLRPVLYNSWEATEFAVNEAGQKALAAKAAELGVERFVMDDGWFGARNNDHAGPGRLDGESPEIPQWPRAADRFRQPVGDGFRTVGGTRDGQPRQQSLPPASRLGHALSRPAAHRVAQSTGSQHGARGREELYLRRARPVAHGESQDRVSEVGHEPQLLRAGLAGSAGGGAEGTVGGVYAQRLRDHRPPARQTSKARNRILLGRRRARGPGNPQPHARRCGRRTIPTPSTACASRRGSPTPILPRP